MFLRRRRRRRYTPPIVVLLLLLTGGAVAWQRTRPVLLTPGPTAGRLLKPAADPGSILPADTEKVHVKFVVDGDTIELEDGRKVRYLGVDTPEFDEPFFKEAKEFNIRQVLGRDAWLEFDVEKKDAHDRLLA